MNVEKLKNIRKEEFKLLCDRVEQKVKGMKRIRKIMSSQMIVNVRLKLENKDSLILRDATQPNQEQAKLYSVLNMDFHVHLPALIFRSWLSHKNARFYFSSM